MTARDCAKLLNSRDNYLLVTHNNPDGDTVMSAAALCRALRRRGKKAFLYNNPQIGSKLLPFLDKLIADETYRYQTVIAVDTATEQMLAKGFEGPVDLAIDHHPTNSHYAAAEMIEAERSACGEIILDVIKELCGDVSKKEATLLYIALTTDTGCFQYANVNARTFAAASELLRCGAEAHKVALHFFRKTSLARLRLEGLIYSNLNVYRDGKLVVAPVTQAMMQEAGATEDDCDDLAGLSGRAEKSEINITIRELPDGRSKVSVRSQPWISSSDICAAFGGGGHDMAAGCTLDAPPEKTERLLLEVIDSLYPERSEPEKGAVPEGKK